MKYDFHIHTYYSKDSNIDPLLLIKKAIKLGFSGIAITDHNIIHPKIKDLAKRVKDLNIIIGEEISSKDGHIIGLYLEESIPPKKTAEETIELIKEQGGLVLIPHPFFLLWRFKALKRIKPDAIEVINGKIPRLLDFFNRKAYEYSKKHNITPYGGSDSHNLSHFGRVYNIIRDNPYKAIKNNKIVVIKEKNG